MKEGYLKETVRFDLQPVGDIRDYLFLDINEIADLLHERVNRDPVGNPTSLYECVAYAEKLHKEISKETGLRFYEREMLWYEGHPIEFTDIRDRRLWSYGRSKQEDEGFLEDIYEAFYEANKFIKFTYRVGFDVANGKQVAVKFVMKPNKVISVGDKDLTKAAMKIVDPDLKDNPKTQSKVDAIHTKAVNEVNRPVHHEGHIDYRSKKLVVDSIFYRDLKNLNKVTLVGAFNKSMDSLLDRLTGGKYTEGTIKIDPYLLDSTFQERLAQGIKNFPDDLKETYSVGSRCGKGRYKTTELIWNLDYFESFKLTPRVTDVTGKEESVCRITED